MLSDQASPIQRAFLQIGAISGYVLPGTWDDQRIQKQLNRSPMNIPLTHLGIMLDPKSKIYDFCAGSTCKDARIFSLNFSGVVFKQQPRQGPATPNTRIGAPSTLSKFREFYDWISQPCCLFQIIGIKEKVARMYRASEINVYNEFGRISDIKYEFERTDDVPVSALTIKPNAAGIRGSVTIHPAELNTRFDLSSFEVPACDRDLKQLSLIIRVADEPDFHGVETTIYIIPLEVKQIEYGGASILDDHNWRLDGFAEQFPDLNLATRDWPDTEIETAKKIIGSEARRKGDSFEFLGVAIPADLTRKWAGILIAVLQLYLFLHLKELTRRCASLKKLVSTDLHPWLFVRRSKQGAVVFYFSVVVLPLVVTVGFITTEFAALQPRDAYGWMSSATSVLAVIAMSALLIKQHIQLRSILLAKPAHADGESEG